MKITRHEISTALLVLLTLGILTAAILLVAAPGVFNPMRSYVVYFDNASGLRPGGQVLLAGRKIGNVVSLESPVPLKLRPPDMPGAEVSVEIRVDEDARIYREVRVVMAQPSLLGEMVLDFSNGDPASGRAPDGHEFLGERSPGLSEAVPTILEKIDPVFKKVDATLEELQTTAANLNRLTADDSDFTATINRFRTLGDNLVALTGPEGELKKTLTNLDEIAAPGSNLRSSLENIDTLTSDLANSGRINQTLAELQRAAENIQSVTLIAGDTVNRIGPRLDETLANTEQLTDTLKRQPWRLVWPSTKSYPDDIPTRRAIPVE